MNSEGQQHILCATHVLCRTIIVHHEDLHNSAQ